MSTSPPRDAAEQPVVVLSSSLLTDRMLAHSGFLDELGKGRPVVVWPRSFDTERGQRVWRDVASRAEPFPTAEPFRQRVNYLRYINDGAWDARLRSPSRASMETHVRAQSDPPHIKRIRRVGGWLGRHGASEHVEALVAATLRRTARSGDAHDRLERLAPALLVVMNPFWFSHEPPVAATAMAMGIKTVAFVPSWDNVSTKTRMTLPYDAYLVWSDVIRDELMAAYPRAKHRPVHVVGAPQFDVFFDPRFDEPRASFCARHELDPSRPIVLYAIGSPNFLKEHHGALAFAQRVKQGDLGDVQLLIRPHPIHDSNQLDAVVGDLGPNVRLQRVPDPARPVADRSQTTDDIIDWVSTFRHSDVVINLASTVTVDAALFDHPVVNLEFDPEPGAPNARLVHDVNHVWTHFKPIAESGGVWPARDMAEVVAATRAYLNDPSLHRAARAALVTRVIGDADGRSGVRLARAVEREASSMAVVQ
jgi:CDP-glycerol glycerophosphotransferase (TagB/SpsB family)